MHSSIYPAETLQQRKATQQQLLVKKVKPTSLYVKPKYAKPYRSHSHSTIAGVSAPTLPLYFYKDYSPSPAVVYVRHEDEANELVQSLSG